MDFIAHDGSSYQCGDQLLIIFTRITPTDVVGAFSVRCSFNPGYFSRPRHSTIEGGFHFTRPVLATS